jgi:ubiquinone/menaquinone biosynthesis C-methylase UbiE
MEPFDQAASSYDRTFTFSETGRRQREVIYKYLEADPFFKTPKVILEVNCGTGEDAMWLAARGHAVVATDSSEAMLAEAKKKDREKMDSPPQFLRLDMKEEVWQWPDVSFDVLFSNFAGLNCFSPVQLQRILFNMNRLLKPGGRLVMVLFGKYCLNEMLYYLLKGNMSAATRRWSGKPAVVNVEGTGVPVYYHAPREIAAMLKGFRLRKKFGVGVFLPPSYLDGSFTRHRQLANFSEAMEKVAGRFAMFSGMGDHILLDFEKR